MLDHVVSTDPAWLQEHNLYSAKTSQSEPAPSLSELKERLDPPPPSPTLRSGALDNKWRVVD